MTWREIYESPTHQHTPESPAPVQFCPTDPVDTVVEHDGKRVLVLMRWGLVPAWWSKPVPEMGLATFNARAETVTEKPMFRDAFRRNRCLIPTSGYYECTSWEDRPTGKQPYYLTRADGEVLATAGIWDEWRDRQSGETIKSCAMIVTESNAFAAEVHDRMPVILDERQIEPWLSGKAGAEILQPAPEDVLRR